MSVKCEILSEDDFKARNAYLRPFMAITLKLDCNHGYVSKYFPGISQYFPVFPGISRYFPVFPGKLPTLLDWTIFLENSEPVCSSKTRVSYIKLAINSKTFQD